jgi:hypothetical protein
MAKAQYLESKMGAVASVGGDVREILKRSLEAADIEDIDKILPEQQPKQPSPMEIAELNQIVADTAGKDAKAQLDNAKAVETALNAQGKKYELEQNVTADGMRARDLG